MLACRKPACTARRVRMQGTYILRDSNALHQGVRHDAIGLW